MSESIKVKICPLSGEVFELTVSLDSRVDSFKQKVADRLRTDTDNIKILLKEKELKFGSLRENNLTTDSRISVLPVMRAGLVGYVTTKSSVLLKSIPDEVLENAEIKAQIRDGDQASITLHIEDMVIVFKLQLIASEPEMEGVGPSTSASSSSSTSTSTTGSASSGSNTSSSSDNNDFHKKFVQYIRKGTNNQSSLVSRGKSDIPLSSELKKFLKDMVIKKLKSEMGMVKSDSDQSSIPSYTKRRSATLESYRSAKRAKILTQCQFEQDPLAVKLSNDCERENKIMKSKIAGLKERMRKTRLQKKRRRSALPCGWTNSSKLLTADNATCQTTCDSVQLALHSVPGPPKTSYGGMKKGFLL